MKKDSIRLANQESTERNNLSDFEFKKIWRKYESQLILPKVKLKNQMMLCPIGLVGAGKTTVLKPLSQKLSLLRISSDEIRKILKREGFNYVRTLEIALGLILKYLNLGYSIAVDADCIDLEKRKMLGDLARQRKIKVIYIHIKPPEKFIINKLTNYKHTWLFKDAANAIDNYKRRKPLHRKYLKTVKFYYRFDTSRADLKSQIKKFVEKSKMEFNLKDKL